jgi:hypothetical protein
MLIRNLSTKTPNASVASSTRWGSRAQSKRGKNSYTTKDTKSTKFGKLIFETLVSFVNFAVKILVLTRVSIGSYDYFFSIL